MKKQHVTLSDDHQNSLRQLLSKGTLPAKTFKRATALWISALSRQCLNRRISTQQEL